MKKDGLVLVLTIIILCAAAAAVAAAGALAEPSGTGGVVEAFFMTGSEKTVSSCFVKRQEYAQALIDKKKRDFDPSTIRFEGNIVPFDSKTDTVYIPQDCGSASWTGSLSCEVPYTGIYILDSNGIDKQKCIEEGSAFKTALVSGDSYMECDLVFTGLPAVCMQSRKDRAEIGKEYSGMICVLDPYREEYQEAVCSFHIRGATSTLFDKKSYRVELTETTSKSDKYSFLGLRTDDDWILNSMCTDKSLAREKICYDLWERLNAMEKQPVASSKIEYCELFLNNEYMGVYGLMYPVDRKLMEMQPGDLLYKVNTWYEEMEIAGCLTDHNGKNEIYNKNGTVYLEIKYPKGIKNACIYDPFELYQDMVFETGDLTEMRKAGISLNMDNFILHELFCEMTRAGDNTWKNMFIAAYRNNSGGYTLSETIWDLNYSFGDCFTWDPDNGNTVFLEDSVNEYKLRYDRDYGYNTLVKAVAGLREDTASKWSEWRSEGISPEYVNALFEKERDYLKSSGAFERNADRWSGPDPEAAYSGIGEWIRGRFLFMDKMYSYED